MSRIEFENAKMHINEYGEIIVEEVIDGECVDFNLTDMLRNLEGIYDISFIQKG